MASTISPKDDGSPELFFEVSFHGIIYLQATSKEIARDPCCQWRSESVPIPAV